MREYYIHNIPLFVVDEPDSGVDIGQFCLEAEETLPHALLSNVEVVYIGNFVALR
jgi:Fe-S cluster assembly ATPase SufC